jgi:hypothetical protein
VEGVRGAYDENMKSMVTIVGYHLVERNPKERKLALF